MLDIIGSIGRKMLTVNINMADARSVRKLQDLLEGKYTSVSIMSMIGLFLLMPVK